jgi:hypothetical protein
MKVLILLVNVLIVCSATAQSNSGYTIVESGKTLVELVKAFRMPKYVQTQQAMPEKKDSCAVKNLTDLSIKNSTTNPLLVSVYRRNGNQYEAGVLYMKILPKQQESLYELKAGIYKIKYEIINDDEEKKLIREGEVKLVACENVFKEIK